jgi:molybdate/tungstate transport system substrate-binding protein
MKSGRAVTFALSLIIIITTGAGSCTSPGNKKTELKILNADSLMVPFQALEREFELKYPDIDVLLEGHGSVQVIRYITELGKQVELAAVADNQLIPMLMYPVTVKGSDTPYADWYIRFATNRLGIAYTDASAYAPEINSDNWFEIMSRPDVRIGLSDPSIDSLGYRVLITIQLAAGFYSDEGLFDRLIQNSFVNKFGINSSGGTIGITVPELLKPSQPRVYLRNYSLQLLALLESGEIDYEFEYESVARQRGLKFLAPPPEIDLSSSEFADNYRRVRVRLGFQRFASLTPEFEGVPIVYGITIPSNAIHRKEAILFLEFLLGEDGQRILAENFQPPIVPAGVDGRNNVPAELEPFLKQ